MLVGFSWWLFLGLCWQDRSRHAQTGFDLPNATMNSQLEHLENQTTSLQSEPMPSFDDPQPSTDESTTDSEVPPSAKVGVEEFQMNSEYLMAKVKELIQQGKVRRLIFKNSQGRTLLDIPLLAGVGGGAVGLTLFPVAVAVAAVAALVSRVNVVVERKED